MLSDDELDEYAASLLTSQANRQASAYSSIGFRAFLRNNVKDGPVGKPNTRFLKNMVRDVDGFNAALARKEEMERKERLDELRRRNPDRQLRYRDGSAGARGSRHDSRVRRERDRSRSPPRRHGRDDDGRGRRKGSRRGDSTDDERGGSRERKSRQRRKSRHEGSEDGADRWLGRDRKRRTRQDFSDDETEKRHHSRRRHRKDVYSPPRHRHSNRRSAGDNSYGHHTHKSSRDVMSPSANRRSPSHTGSQRVGRIEVSSGSIPLSPASPDSSIGPRVPIEGPEFVQAKGRGRMNGGTLDAKFSESYDPRADLDAVHSEPEENFVNDDWGLALRALREREAYILSGKMTERLVETQSQNPTTAGPTYSKGEREWDKGKVILDDGSVGIRVWGVDKRI